MEPREKKPRRKRGGQRSNQNDMLMQMLEEADLKETLNFGQMNLYGASELMQQIGSEDNQLRRKKKWMPKHNHIRELEP